MADLKDARYRRAAIKRKLRSLTKESTSLCAFSEELPPSQYVDLSARIRSTLDELQQATDHLVLLHCATIDCEESEREQREEAAAAEHEAYYDEVSSELLPIMLDLVRRGHAQSATSSSSSSSSSRPATLHAKMAKVRFPHLQR